MKKMFDMLRILFCPHWLIILILFGVSAYGLFYSFTNTEAIPFIQYISYALSFYTLVVIVVSMPSIYKTIKNGIESNSFTNRLVKDKEYRIRFSLITGFMINVIYALIKLSAGWYYQSMWIGAIAIYYIILSLMRLGLLIREYFNVKGKYIENQRERDLKRYRLVGCFMFLLNIAVSGLVIQMIWNNESYNYPGILIFANAAYTFYSFGTAIVNLFKYRKMEKPVLSAAKMLSFVCALTSMLSLQTAMLYQFAEEGQEAFVRIMNTLTGSGVCLIIFGMAIWMIKKANKELYTLEGKDE